MSFDRRFFKKNGVFASYIRPRPVNNGNGIYQPWFLLISGSPLNYVTGTQFTLQGCNHHVYRYRIIPILPTFNMIIINYQGQLTSNVCAIDNDSIYKVVLLSAKRIVFIGNSFELYNSNNRMILKTRWFSQYNN